MRLRKMIVMMSLAALLLAAAGPLHAQEDDGEDGGDPEAGAELYAVNCVVCHGEQGQGRVGAALDHVYGGINPDAFFEATISRGIEGTFMPPWSEEFGGPLAEDQIEDIVAYIESWGTAVEPPAPAPRQPEQEIPPVPEVSGDPNAGFAVYQTNCLACHGEDGEGRIGATLDVAFGGIEPGAFVLETIRRGREGTLMPPFAQEFGGPLSDEEIQNVAAYVFSIQGPAQPEPQGEIVGRASAWPLVVVAAGTVILVVAAGIAISRRESGAEEVDEQH